MHFSDFAQMIGGVLRGDASTSAFAKTLFECILPNEKLYLLEGISSDTFKSYYNGQKRINAIARKININVTPKAFERYIRDCEKVAATKLCEVFADTVTGMDETNAAKMLAELFNKIITEAAAVQRNTKQKPTAIEKSITKREDLKLKVASGNSYIENRDNVEGVEESVIYVDKNVIDNAAKVNLACEESGSDNNLNSEATNQYYTVNNFGTITSNQNIGNVYGGLTIKL